MHNPQFNMQPEPLVASPLTVGSKVTYTNEFGVSFSGYTVKGFSTDKTAPDQAYVDSDCYWFPKPFSSLAIEERPNFLFYDNCELSIEHRINSAMAFSTPITQSEFDTHMTAIKIASGRANAVHCYQRLGNIEMAETFATAEFKNPRMGVSDGTLGRNGCLTLLVELGPELLVYDAGRAWNNLIQKQ